MKRILHIISPGSGNFGGIESFLCGYYEYMDKKEVLFDFSFCGSNTMKMKMKDPIFHNSTFKEYRALLPSNNTFTNWITLIKLIKEQVKRNTYDIVEVHSASPLIQAVCGFALKQTQIPMRIAHSHAMAGPINSWKQSIANAISTLIIQNSYDYYFSCSYAAASLYGDKVLKSNRFVKVNNAIDADEFAFNASIRTEIRKNYNIDKDTRIIGHVARLAPEKNQCFLIDVFNEYHKIDPHSILWIVGEGQCREEIENRIKRYNLHNSVTLFGERKDVSELLQAMDAFVVTSYLEGLCISAIESQAAGLPTLTSTGIPEECEITGLIHRIDLEKGSEFWGKKLSDIVSNNIRTSMKDAIKKAGYDLQYAAKSLQGFYMQTKEIR